MVANWVRMLLCNAAFLWAKQENAFENKIIPYEEKKTQTKQCQYLWEWPDCIFWFWKRSPREKEKKERRKKEKRRRRKNESAALVESSTRSHPPPAPVTHMARKALERHTQVFLFLSPSCPRYLEFNLPRWEENPLKWKGPFSCLFFFVFLNSPAACATVTGCFSV